MKKYFWGCSCKLSALTIAINIAISGMSIQSAQATNILVDDGSEHVIDTPLSGKNWLQIVNGTLSFNSSGTSTVSPITVGSKGKNGTLNITNGAQLKFTTQPNTTSSLNIGGSSSAESSHMDDFNGGTGTVNISGTGSQLDVSSATINIGGQGGTGYLNITEGGILNHASQSSGYQGIYIGSFGGYQGTQTEGHVLVDGHGSQLNINDDQLAVGAFSHGTLDIRNGAHVTLTDGSVLVGYSKASGHVRIIGKDSQLYTNQKITVTSGDVIVSDGATLSAQSLVLTRSSQVSDSTSKLVIGASEEDAAVSAGQVDINSISMSDRGIKKRLEMSLILNHTDSDYHLNANIDNVNDTDNDAKIKALHGTTFLEGDNANYRGELNISQPAKIVVSTQRNLGDSIIADNGELRLQSHSDWNFINSISGTGILTAETGGNHFNFVSDAPGTTFAGTLNLENTKFNLEDINTAAMAQSTLLAGTNSLTQVGQGTQTIGGLAFNGGTLVYGDVSPGDTTSGRFIHTTGDLNLTGQGQVQITESDIFENTLQHPDTTAPLMQQDDDGVLVQLAGSQGTVTGDAGNLTAVDRNGNVISAAATASITQSGETVAHGFYDWRLTSGKNNDGLYINYGLTEVELLAQGNNALALSAEGNTGNAADLSAKVTGSGDLRIDTDTDVSLSNSENSYSGTTWVTAGGLTMGNNNVLGQTRLLELAGGTHLDMNGYAQTLQNLQTDAGSTLDFNQGSLTVNNGTVDGNMSGAGSLTVAGGTLTVSSDNAAMSADTTIASDGVIRMLSSQALGTGSVNNQGLLYLGQDGDSHVTRDTLTNYQTGALTNSGTVVIGHNDVSGQAIAGTTLTVNGNYTGENGHLQFNTVLGDDSSATDKLIVTGDTSGDTGVSVKNAGGVGDKTLNGIELISVGGQSDGTFTQEGRIVAGAYDYALVRGQGSNQGNWYLTSQTSPIDPVDPPVDPVDPPVKPPVDPVDPPVTPPAEGEHVNRPEGGSYIANLAAANTLFNTRLHDRLGETQYVDALTGEKKVTSLWLRQVGGHNNWRDSSGQLKTQSNSYVAQLGGDVAQWSTDGLNRGHLGLMTGYANSHNQTHSSVTGYDSKGSINGYSAGVYGTWFANDADKSGLYVDSWLQYSWFNNHVNGEQLASESYKSKGLTASLETGYTLKMGEFTGNQGTLNEWFIQPQAQATWMGVKADKHREDNGTRVNSEGDGNVQTRLGMRAYLKSHHAMDEGKGRTFEPFIEANWLHNTRSYSAKMDDVRISQAGARNIGEVKVGIEGQINPRLNLWGNVGTQVGDKGYNDSTAMIGVKYNF